VFCAAACDLLSVLLGLIGAALGSLDTGLLLELIASNGILSRYHAVQRLVQRSLGRLETLLVLRLAGGQRRLSRVQNCFWAVVTVRPEPKPGSVDSWLDWLAVAAAPSSTRPGPWSPGLAH